MLFSFPMHKVYVSLYSFYSFARDFCCLLISTQRSFFSKILQLANVYRRNYNIIYIIIIVILRFGNRSQSRAYVTRSVMKEIRTNMLYVYDVS